MDDANERRLGTRMKRNKKADQELAAGGRGEKIGGDAVGKEQQKRSNCNKSDDS